MRANEHSVSMKFISLLAVTIISCAAGQGGLARAGDSPAPRTGASAAASEAADAAMYRPVEYRNASKRGPAVVVLPGDIKSSNATFTQKFTANNIADYAELELGKANFNVLERSDLGSLMREFSIAYEGGDPQQARKLLSKGKLKGTKWVMRFDVLKAEPVAQAQSGFSGSGLLRGLNAIGVGGGATGVVGTVDTTSAAGIWIVGMRYKIIDASTTEQKATGYFEQKMELGSKTTSIAGFSKGQQGGLTLDSLVQRLTQTCVAEIDERYK